MVYISEKAYVPPSENIETFEGGKIEQPKYYPTYYEWLKEQSEQIFIYNDKNDAAEETIYTVPEGNVLYITDICLSFNSNSDTGGEKSSIKINSTPIFEIYPIGAVAVNQTTTITSDFRLPIKVTENQTIRFDNPSFSYSTCCIQGFLVSKNVIKII